ncbi:MAG: hypothetical protein NPIRA01_00250 [Nitrospirales bacterium]|nr:MAG: hypothetical protein NPIRA01_00250 [Nitrospirales bacterium]
MVPHKELTLYQQDLVQELLDQAERRRTESLGSLQVFIGDKSLGSVECADQVKTEKVFDIGATSDPIELRSSSGLPVGLLSVESLKPSTAQFLVGQYRIELWVKPQDDTSVLHLTLTNLLAIPRQVQALDDDRVENAHHMVTKPSNYWSTVALAAQVILAVGVVMLVVDRFSSTMNAPSGQSLQVDLQKQQLQQVLQQLTALENRLGTTPVVPVKHEGEDVLHDDLEIQTVSQVQTLIPDTSVLETKPVSAEKGLLERRPVWVRFKKGVADIRRSNFFKEVSAQEHAQVGGWYSFNLDIPKSQQFDDVLGSFEKSDDIEVITTSVVTRRVRVRFKNGSNDHDITKFFEEIRIPQTAPKGDWYDLNLSLPEPVQPKSFINELRSRSIVDQVKVDLDGLPSF